LQIKTAVESHAGAKVVVVVYNGDRHGITQATTVSVWTTYLNALKTTVDTLQFEVVALEQGDPHQYCWVDAVKRGCDGVKESECWMLAGDDRADYAIALAQYIKKVKTLKLKYEIPDVGRFEGLSATKLCKEIEALRAAGKTPTTLSGPQSATLAAFLPTELSAEQITTVLTDVWATAIEADQPAPPPADQKFCCCNEQGEAVSKHATIEDFRDSCENMDTLLIVEAKQSCSVECRSIGDVEEKICCCKNDKSGAYSRHFSHDDWNLKCTKGLEKVILRDSSCRDECTH